MGGYCRAYGKSSAEKHSQPHPVTNTHVTFAFSGVGKNWAGPFFPHPDKVKQQPCSEGYWVGGYCRAYGKSSAEKHSQPYPVMNAHVTVAF